MAIGDSSAGGQGGDAGLVAEGGEVVDTGQAHHLPPRVAVLGVALLGVGTRVLGAHRTGLGEQPRAHPAFVGGRRELIAGRHSRHGSIREKSHYDSLTPS